MVKKSPNLSFMMGFKLAVSQEDLMKIANPVARTRKDRFYHFDLKKMSARTCLFSTLSDNTE